MFTDKRFVEGIRGEESFFKSRLKYPDLHNALTRFLLEYSGRCPGRDLGREAADRFFEAYPYADWVRDGRLPMGLIPKVVRICTELNVILCLDQDVELSEAAVAEALHPLYRDELSLISRTIREEIELNYIVTRSFKDLMRIPAVHIFQTPKHHLHAITFAMKKGAKVYIDNGKVEPFEESIYHDERPVGVVRFI